MDNYLSPNFGPFNSVMYNPSLELQAWPPIHQTMPLSSQDFELRAKIVKQVDYYFRYCSHYFTTNVFLIYILY